MGTAVAGVEADGADWASGEGAGAGVSANDGADAAWGSITGSAQLATSEAINARLQMGKAKLLRSIISLISSASLHALTVKEAAAGFLRVEVNLRLGAGWPMVLVNEHRVPYRLRPNAGIFSTGFTGNRRILVPFTTAHRTNAGQQATNRIQNATNKMGRCFSNPGKRAWIGSDGPSWQKTMDCWQEARSSAFGTWAGRSDRDCSCNCRDPACRRRLSGRCQAWRGCQPASDCQQRGRRNCLAQSVFQVPAAMAPGSYPPRLRCRWRRPPPAMA